MNIIAASLTWPEALVWMTFIVMVGLVLKWFLDA